MWVVWIGVLRGRQVRLVQRHSRFPSCSWSWTEPASRRMAGYPCRVTIELALLTRVGVPRSGDHRSPAAWPARPARRRPPQGLQHRPAGGGALAGGAARAPGRGAAGRRLPRPGPAGRRRDRQHPHRLPPVAGRRAGRRLGCPPQRGGGRPGGHDVGSLPAARFRAVSGARGHRRRLGCWTGCVLGTCSRRRPVRASRQVEPRELNPDGWLSWCHAQLDGRLTLRGRRGVGGGRVLLPGAPRG